MHVVVVGGGIAGLCLAQGLRRAGVSVAVYERDRSRTDRLDGYRIHINPAGSRALKACLPPPMWDSFVATSVATPPCAPHCTPSGKVCAATAWPWRGLEPGSGPATPSPAQRVQSCLPRAGPAASMGARTTVGHEDGPQDMTAAEIFWVAHTGLPREAPGSDATTRLLLRLAGPLPPQPRVIDIGAGTGPASLVLAAEGAKVTAIDTHPPFLAR